MSPALSHSAISAYQSVGVESLAKGADPHLLVVMLFNGARTAIAVAKGHLQRKEVAAKGVAIGKAIAIIDGGLKASLDLNVGGEMAQNLSDLYVYMGQRLLQANLNNDAKALDEVALLLQQLGSAWESIAAKPAAVAAAVVPVPAARAAPAPTPAARPDSTPPPVMSPQSRRLASAYGAF